MEFTLRPALFALFLTALPAFAQEAAVFEPDLPEGYPPKMGDVSGEVNGVATHWETFDFSIGAFDGSAWAGADWETKLVTAHIMAYAPGEPERMEGRLYAEADFGRALRTGKGRKVAVEIYAEQDREGPRLTSEGQKAVFVIESIGPKVEGSYSRKVTGRIEARLCPVDWPEQACQDVTLRFDTRMQIESSVKVRG